MSWIAVGVMAAGAGMGMMENKRKQEMQERTANANADATAVSWARKNGQGNIPQIRWNDSSMLGDMFKGGLSGYMMGSGIKGGMGAGAAPATAEAGTAMKASNPYGTGMDWNTLGSPGMAMSPGTQGQAMAQTGGTFGKKPMLFGNWE